MVIDVTIRSFRLMILSFRDLTVPLVTSLTVQLSFSADNSFMPSPAGIPTVIIIRT